MEQRYIVRGGGWYVGVYNTRTKKYKWVNKGDLKDLKRTETYKLTEEQANGLEYKNSVAFMKMAGLKKELITEEN